MTFVKDALGRQGIFENNGELDLNDDNMIGDIISSLSTEPNEKWLECNGQIVGVADYPDLYAICQQKYKQSTDTFDEEVYFRVPNLNGRILWGTTTNANVGVFLSQALPAITGNCGNILVDDGATLYNSGALRIEGGTRERSWNGTSGDACKKVSFYANYSNSTYSGSVVRPNCIQVYYLIKAK